MSDLDRYLTPERRAELRRQAERARPFVRQGGVDPAGTFVIAADLLALLDAVDERDARTDVPRLVAEIRRAKAEAWDEGYMATGGRGHHECEATNPYTETQQEDES